MKVLSAYTVQCMASIAGGLIIWDMTNSVLFAILAELILLSTIFTIIPFTSDRASKKVYDSPYVRCDGCGSLKSEKDSTEWDGYTICGTCSSDTYDRRAYAVQKPMILKRLNKK